MLDNRLVVAVIGGACVLAAGTGAFVATRMNEGPTETVLAARPAAPLASVHEPVTLVDTPREVAAPSRPTAGSGSSRPAVATRAAERRPAAGRASASAPSRTQAERPEPPMVVEPAAPAEPMRTERLTPLPPFDLTAAPAASAPRYEELVIASDSVIGLRIENTVSSESARVEDQVEARVNRDVMVDGRVALPVGSRVIGHVTQVDRGGKVRERAQLAVRFHTLLLADGSSLPIQTETIFREGDSPAAASSAKIGGGAVGGAVIGAILGGTKGAVIGGSAGAAGGTAAVMAGSRKSATLQGGSSLTVRVLSPVTVTVER